MIEFNGRYRFTKIPLNIFVEKYQLIKRRNGIPEYDWVKYGYYGTIKQALLDIFNDMITDTINSGEQLDLQDLINTINKSEKEIIDFCNSNKELFSREIYKIEKEVHK